LPGLGARKQIGNRSQPQYREKRGWRHGNKSTQFSRALAGLDS
jgi:hypothetical protein